MLAIGFRFLAGRYHANPWGRHVNEADIEWPPAPWRVSRALISTWYHKADPQRFPFDQLEALIDVLSEERPVYHLPPAVHAHTRHYMPQWKGNTSLVFDAFARVNPESELVIVWPDVDLPDKLALLLDELLHKVGYLGRAESWVEARRVPDDELPDGFPCLPGEQDVNAETGEVLGDVVRLLLPRPHQDYAQWRHDFARNELTSLKGKKKKLLQKTTPEGLVDALSVDTSDLQQAGWSQPPAGQYVDYLRPLDCLRPRLPPPGTHSARATTARFMLTGKPLPRVEDAVRIGERFRAALMGRARQVLGGQDRLPRELTGHDLGPGNRHGHAFYLPEDADGDGRIDHLLLHAPGGLSVRARKVLERFTLFRGHGGVEWRVILEGAGQVTDFRGDSFHAGKTTVWQSVTPYLRPWHLKKKLSEHEQVEAFIRKECRLRGLPEPEKVEWLPEITVHGRPRRTIHFHRFRNKRGLTQPDTRGYFLCLRFAQPVSGPLALGFGCHYGLGLFQPVSD
ncbi:MAG TPA: type I-U CRISPR-associated protein Cas5/Cas6 [Chromatiales bacterium]|nr:type I-U CRISPR-associated protein Cas5/Cas6 [Chromatiales bacterium]